MDSKLCSQHAKKSLGELKVFFQKVAIFSIILNVPNKTTLTIKGTSLKMIKKQIYEYIFRFGNKLVFEEKRLRPLSEIV